MTNTFKRILYLFTAILIATAVVSFFFFKHQMESAKEITSVDNLSGQKIGVISAYEGDYLLTYRDDITLQRFDSEADVILALCYRKIDAFATTEDAAQYILEKTNGLKINEKPIANNGMATLFQEGSEYLDEFADFIEVYRNTDEYSDYLERCKNQEYYDGSLLTEETGTGKVIRCGYCYDYIPVVFYDTIHKGPNGSEVDIWRAFANYMGYQIDWVKIGEAESYAELAAGKIDVYLDGYSEVYRKECDDSPDADMGACYRDSYIVLLEVEDYDKLSISAISEEED